MSWRWLQLGSALLPACVPAGGAGLSETPAGAPAAIVGRADPDQPTPTTPPKPLDPPRLLADPGSGISVVWAGAAAASAVAGAELVVLEPDLRHLGAYDWNDGKPRWRIELPVSAATQLYGLGDRVLLHDRDHAIVIEAARGRVLGRHPAPGSGRWPYVHRVQQSHGACAWVGPCGIQAFDCADGAPRGDYLASDEAQQLAGSNASADLDGGCGVTPRLLGRYAGTIVLVAGLPSPEESEASSSTAALVGLDAASGELRWRHPLPDGSSADVTRATADGACWILARSAPQLVVLDCGTGAPRWERSIGEGTLEVFELGENLVVGREHGGRWRLSAYRATDGQPGWSARLARRERPLFPDGPVPDAQGTGARRVYALVDPSNGRVAGELVAGRDETLWRDPSGGFVLIGRDLREVDGEGRLTRMRPFSGLRVHAVTATHVLSHEADAIEVFDRDQLRERARLEGRLMIDMTASLPDERLLLVRYGEDGVALVLGLEPPSRGIRRD